MPIRYLINVKPLFVAYSPWPDEVTSVRYVQPLTDEQRELLEKTMHEETSFRARSRAHSLLLSAAGGLDHGVGHPINSCPRWKNLTH